MELFLAKTNPHLFAVIKISVVIFHLIFTALCVYLASQAVMNFPALRIHFAKPYVQILFHGLILVTSVSIVYYIPLLRFFHASGLIYAKRVFLWPDIILSAFALARMSFIWHYLFRWLERRSS